MSPNVELREIEVFLALAQELHFGRTADRLGLTPARVSQVLRELERKLGSDLLNRNSRNAVLTPFGERVLAEIRSPYEQLLASLDRARDAGQSLAGTLRLGLLAANAGGSRLITIIEKFERLHPECEVSVREILFTDPLGPLRRGEIEIMATRLPISRPDITVGPVLAREPVILAVADDHPLVRRGRVSLEDLADYLVAPITDSPRELIDAVFPRHTPAGRAIRRRAQRPQTPHEVTTLVARGVIVHLTVPSFAQYFGQPGITYLPVTDMPPAKSGLVWRRRSTDPRMREFIRLTRETLQAERTPARGSSGKPSGQ